MSICSLFNIITASPHRLSHNLAILLVAAVVALAAAPGYSADLTETKKLLPSDAAYSDWFGTSVSISGDYAIVGAKGADVASLSGSGAAYIFEYSGGNWNELPRLSALVPSLQAAFGTSVAISGDTAIAGSPSHTNTAQWSGSADVFQRSATGTWDHITKLAASDAGAYEGFGNSVAISGDYAIVGAPTIAGTSAQGPGAAYVFERAGGTWSEVKKLVPADGAEDDLFGYAVAINGNHAIVGAPRKDSASHPDAGAVYFFMRSAAGVWEPVNKMIDPDGDDNDQFGWSVSIEGDLAIAGAPLHDESAGADAGSALVMRYWNSFWFPSEELEAIDGAAGDQFGYSVSLSSHYAVIGSLKYTNSTGAAYVFQQTSHPVGTALTDWQHTDRLVASGTSPWGFGSAVALSSSRALVGAQHDSVTGLSSGSAYLYNIFAEPEPPEAPAVGFLPGVFLLLNE